MPRRRLPPDTPDRILEIVSGFQLSKIFFAALEFDIFSILERRGLTVGEVADTCKPLTGLSGKFRNLGMLTAIK
jgi:hypothetical protein